MVTRMNSFTLGLLELMLATAVVYLFPSRQGPLFLIVYVLSWASFTLKVIWLTALALYDIHDWTSAEYTFVLKALTIIGACGFILVYSARRPPRV